MFESKRNTPFPKVGIALGHVHYEGPPVASIQVENVPASVKDSELAAFVQELAWSPRGLRISRGDSSRPCVTYWTDLLAQADASGIPYPESALEARIIQQRARVRGAEITLSQLRGQGDERAPAQKREVEKLQSELERLEAKSA
jgi:hypothetical protein